MNNDIPKAAVFDQAVSGPGGETDLQLLREVLDGDLAGFSSQPVGPKLLVLAGLPGSGKTHFARRVVDETPFLTLESDRLRKALVRRPRYTPGEHRRVFAACHLLVEEYLAQGVAVLFDATNLTDRFRTPLYRIAESLAVPLAVVEVTAPRETVRRRLRSREAGLDQNTNSDAGWLVYCRMAPHWEPINRERFVVDTSVDIAPVVEQVVNWSQTTRVVNSDKNDKREG